MSTSTLQEDVALSDKKHERTVAPAPASPVTQKRKLSPLLERYKMPALIVAGLVVLIAIIVYLADSFTHEETDDAYVTGHLHEISSRINGVVTQIMVNDNQFVHSGDILVTLDPSEYMALATAAKANLATAQSNLDRLQPLIGVHAIAPEDVDKARNTVDVDKAQYELAALQIQYCTLAAPASGTIGRKNIEVGNRVSSGQTLMVVVEPELWVVANFKETQLAKMKIGQHARISIDSIPDKVFDGVVNSFSPATGNEFALLPADNSTGNFTKIVQRIPVKVVFDPDSIRGFESRIRAGESAVVKVAIAAPASSQK